MVIENIKKIYYLNFLIKLENQNPNSNIYFLFMIKKKFLDKTTDFFNFK